MAQQYHGGNEASGARGTTAINTNSNGSPSIELQTYFDARTLEVAEENLVLRQFAVLRPLPSRHSLTIQFTRYEKLAIPTAALTEGSPPANVPSLQITTITATVSQWGDYIKITDLAELTFNHPVVDETLYVLGLQAAELIHKEIEDVLVAGTNVQYANGRAARTDIAAGDVMTTKEVIGAVRTLRNNSARMFKGSFIAVIDPSVEADLLQDVTFLEATRYSAAERLWRGEVAKWMGATFVVSEALNTIASTVTVHTCYFIAQHSYAITDLQDLRVIHHAPGTGGPSDPLNQIRTLGWKCSFATCILNNNWLVRVECAASA